MHEQASHGLPEAIAFLIVSAMALGQSTRYQGRTSGGADVAKYENVKC